MCDVNAPSTLSRRGFLCLGALGSAALASPLPLAAWLRGVSQEAAPLDVARDAARWIRASRLDTPHGAAWPAVPGVPGSVGATLYHGTPGVILFLAELAHAAGDTEALGDAVAGGDHLLGLLDAGELRDPGLYTGLAGIAFTLERLHAVSGSSRFRDGAMRCIDRIVATARPDGGGVGWGAGEMSEASSDIVSGAAGIGLTLLWAHERLGHADALALASAAGDRLVNLGEPAEDGLCWRISPTFPRNYPNFSHGTGGVAYFLTRLHGRTAAARHQDAAIRGGIYLEQVSRRDGDGSAVFHHTPGGEDLFYLSWCHGPAGTARLFHQLGVSTGDPRWTAWVERGARAIQAYGTPERRSAGYWNNVSQCCGDAGVGDFFLALEGVTGDRRHGDFAERIGRWLLGQADGSENGRRWVQAENRVSPEDVAAQTGWMQGAAGVGAFFLHLDGRRADRKALVTLPDSPWEALP